MKIGLTEARVQVSESQSPSLDWPHLHDCPREPSRGRGERRRRRRHVCFSSAPRRRYTKVDQLEDPVFSGRIRASSACY